MTIEFGEMYPDERPLVESLKGKHKVVNEFLSMWKLWKNWEKHPPVLALDSFREVTMIAGLYAFTITKSGYVNSYFIWVDDNYRGQRIAGSLVEEMLYKARVEQDVPRFKTRVPVNGDGHHFWTGFGLKPVGEISNKNELLFDFSLKGVNSIDTLIKRSSKLNSVVTTDKRSLSHYQRLGVVFTDPHWRHLNGKS